MAVDVPAEVRESLAAWAREATTQGGAVRVLSPSLLHLTLAFLGERPSREIDLIADLALGCAQPAASLSLAGPVWLPPRRPRALAVEIADPTGALHDLQRSVVQALVAGAGHELEGRRFRPHLTVARRGSGPAGRGLAMVRILRADADAPPLATCKACTGVKPCQRGLARCETSS